MCFMIQTVSLLLESRTTVNRRSWPLKPLTSYRNLALEYCHDPLSFVIGIVPHGLLPLYSFDSLYPLVRVTNMDLALPRMRWAMDLQGPTGHMAACDWTQTKKMSQDPGWWPITRWHHCFPSFIEAPHASPPSLIESPRRLSQDPAGIPPRFYQGIPLRVMVLDDLMALVLRTKSIGQWPFTLVDRTF